MRKRILTTIVVLLAVTAAHAQRPDPKESRRIQEVLIAWFECEECNEGELRRVVALGRKIVPTLGATLQQGPAPASRELYRLRLRDAYDELQAYARSHPEEKIDLPSRDKYVTTYLDNYIATYKIRAAKALGAIGGTEATAALRRGLERPERDDVKAAINRALPTR